MLHFALLLIQLALVAGRRPGLEIRASSGANFEYSRANLRGRVWNDRPYVFSQLSPTLRGATLFSGPVFTPNGEVLTMTRPNFPQNTGFTFYALLTANRGGRWTLRRRRRTQDSLLRNGWTREDGLSAAWDFRGRAQPMDVYSLRREAGENPSVTLPRAAVCTGRDRRFCGINNDIVGTFLLKIDNDVTAPIMVATQNTTECGYNGVDAWGQSQLNGGGHTREECRVFCENDPNCRFAAYFYTGFCHTFTTCRGTNGVGGPNSDINVVWRKVDAPLAFLEGNPMNQVMASVPTRTVNCDFNGVDAEGQFSLGGGGHTLDRCRFSCLERGNSCNYAAWFVETGFCNHFTTCNGRSSRTGRDRRVILMMKTREPALRLGSL